MTKLNWLESQVLELRKTYSLRDCSRILRTTIGRVRSIEQKAKTKLAALAKGKT